MMITAPGGLPDLVSTCLGSSSRGAPARHGLPAPLARTPISSTRSRFGKSDDGRSEADAFGTEVCLPAESYTQVWVWRSRVADDPEHLGLDGRCVERRGKPSAVVKIYRTHLWALLLQH
jgi:hypothetical protein